MSLWLLIFMMAASWGAGSLLVAYFQKRAKLEPSRKGLLVFPCVMAGIFVAYFALKQVGIDLFRGIPNLIYQATIALLAFRAIVARIRCGVALADLGPSPFRTMFLLSGVLMTGAWISELIRQGVTAGQGIVGIWFLVLGLLRNRICDGGICWGEGVLQWKHIACYEWRNGSTMMVELRRRFWWQQRVQIPVLPENVDAVDRVMSQHLGRAPA